MIESLNTIMIHAAKLAALRAIRREESQGWLPSANVPWAQEEAPIAANAVNSKTQHSCLVDIAANAGLKGISKSALRLAKARGSDLSVLDAVHCVRVAKAKKKIQGKDIAMLVEGSVTMNGGLKLGEPKGIAQANVGVGMSSRLIANVTALTAPRNGAENICRTIQKYGKRLISTNRNINIPHLIDTSNMWRDIRPVMRLREGF